MFGYFSVNIMMRKFSLVSVCFGIFFNKWIRVFNVICVIGKLLKVLVYKYCDKMIKCDF